MHQSAVRAKYIFILEIHISDYVFFLLINFTPKSNMFLFDMVQMLVGKLEKHS